MRLSATLVLLGGLAYLGAVTYAGAITPGYDHCTQLISELGQVGAPAAPLMRWMLISLGSALSAFAWLLRRSAPPPLRSRIGPWLLGTIGLGLILGGIFQCDPRCVPVTVPGWLHLLTSIPATLGTLIAPFVYGRAMGGHPGWSARARISRALGGLSLAGLGLAVLVFPNLGIQGIGQRIATALPILWVQFLAGCALLAPSGAIPDDPGRWPPGPSGLGALRYLGPRRRLLEFVERCRRDFGGVVGIRIFGQRLCLISDPERIHQVFVQHAPRIKKWDLGQFDLILGQGLLTSQGELWRRQRRLIQPVFLPDRLDGYTGPILESAEEMLDRWRDGEVIEAHVEMMRLSLRISAEVLFGADSSALEGLIGETHGRLLGQFERALTGIPIPLSIPTLENLRTRRAVRELDRAVLGLIARRRRERLFGDDFLGVLLKAREDPASGLDDRQLRDECMTMILAAHETTAVTLTWTLLLLAEHPERADRLAETIRQQVGGDAITPAHLQAIPGLDEVLREAMRLYTPVWAIGRVNTEPIEVGDHLLPEGTQIFLVPWLTHRDPGSFADPLSFRPERWGSGEPAVPRNAYLPFGAGPRKCVGTHFAMREMELILASILQRFRLLRASEEAPELRPSVTLRPGSGIRLRVERRSEAAAGQERR